MKQTLKKYGALGVATGGLVGYIPIASGTFGSAVGAAVVWGWRGWPIWLQVVLCVLISALGIWASGEANRIFRKADASYIVVDEIAGMMITMIAIPVTPYWLLWGFILFRIFDILKPPPADYFDSSVKTGAGVMMDDIVAGIYANLLLHLMIRASL